MNQSDDQKVKCINGMSLPATIKSVVKEYIFKEGNIWNSKVYTILYHFVMKRSLNGSLIGSLSPFQCLHPFASFVKYCKE